MSSFKRIAAGASALVLASGAALAGAGVAGAQGSSEIAADLELAATALNGPVSVAGNNEGGPTVTYTNRNEVDQNCVGFTMPYSTVDEEGIDPSDIGGDLIAALPLLAAIEAAGGVSILSADEEGDPTASDSTGDGIFNAALALIDGGGVVVSAEETVKWTATQPATPAAAVLLCLPDPEGGLLDLNFGIDPQVVADQINDRLGPLGSIGAGSVSGGSVGAGASLLGSLGDIGGNGDDDGAGGEDGTDTGSGSGNGSGSGDDDEENGNVPLATFAN